MELKETAMGAIDINAFDYKSVPPEECDRLRQQAVRRAHLARGRALRHVIGSGVRALRAAAASALLGAAAETAVTTAGNGGGPTRSGASAAGRCASFVRSTI